MFLVAVPRFPKLFDGDEDSRHLAPWQKLHKKDMKDFSQHAIESELESCDVNRSPIYMRGKVFEVEPRVDRAAQSRKFEWANQQISCMRIGRGSMVLADVARNNFAPRRCAMLRVSILPQALGRGPFVRAGKMRVEIAAFCSTNRQKEN
jgi:hypothetical protein